MGFIMTGQGMCACPPCMPACAPPSCFCLRAHAHPTQKVERELPCPSQVRLALFRLVSHPPPSFLQGLFPPVLAPFVPSFHRAVDSQRFRPPCAAINLSHLLLASTCLTRPFSPARLSPPRLAVLLSYVCSLNSIEPSFNSIDPSFKAYYTCCLYWQYYTHTAVIHTYSNRE